MKIYELTESVDDSKLINKIANSVAKWMHKTEPAEHPVQTIEKMTGIKGTPLSKVKIAFDYLDGDKAAELWFDLMKEVDHAPLPATSNCRLNVLTLVLPIIR